MEAYIQWEEGGVDSVNGYTVRVTTLYSSFNEEEIQKIIESLKVMYPGPTSIKLGS